MGIAAMLLVGCAVGSAPTPSPTPTAGPSPTPQDISAEQAAAIAREQGGPSVTAVESVRSGPLGGFTDSLNDDSFDLTQLVWAVRLSGEWAGSCPPTTPRRPCPIEFTHALVILDYETGELITEILNS
jgi:hypothetical protein